MSKFFVQKHVRLVVLYWCLSEDVFRLWVGPLRHYKGFYAIRETLQFTTLYIFFPKKVEFAVTLDVVYLVIYMKDLCGLYGLYSEGETFGINFGTEMLKCCTSYLTSNVQTATIMSTSCDVNTLRRFWMTSNFSVGKLSNCPSLSNKWRSNSSCQQLNYTGEPQSEHTKLLLNMS